MRLLVILFFLGCSIKPWAQEINVITQGDKTLPKLKKDDPLHFLEQGIDTTQLTFVATVKVMPGESKSVEAMYNKVGDYARKSGANAFTLKEFDDDATTLIVQLYYATDKVLQQNETLKPTNTLYIFAGEKNEKTEYYSFEFNGAPKTIKNGTYFQYKLKEGEQVKLKKGGVTGTTMWIKWKPDQLPHYSSIHGFYNEPVVARTTVSQSFKPGKFLPIDDNFGRFLTLVLTAME